MTDKDKIRLQHILDESKEALGYIQDMHYADFAVDGKTARAVIRCLEVIGEASARISQEGKEKYPEIPWNKIIGMRNHLIHVYFDIDYATVWKTLKENIPNLVEKLETINLEDLE